MTPTAAVDEQQVVAPAALHRNLAQGNRARSRWVVPVVVLKRPAGGAEQRIDLLARLRLWEKLSHVSRES